VVSRLVQAGDRARPEQGLDQFLTAHAAEHRPDIIGGGRFWVGPDSAYDVTYFTSEADARAGESKPLPPAMEEFAPELAQLMARTEFFDLGDPWLY
jgi:hypothetical protein